MTLAEIDRIFRNEAGRVLATLIRLVGDFDLAEDALQDAFAVALEKWPTAEPPANPRAWLVNVGRNKAIDRVRRLVSFRDKQEQVTHELLLEKVYARLQPSGGGTPDVDFLRAIRTNLRYHMSYISHLADRRRWLAGEELSFADLAAAAHLSSVDYLGEVPWEEFAVAKVWYARLKSRRAFRTILADRVPGALPSAHYADLDF